jgi:hypothetical protein
MVYPDAGRAFAIKRFPKSWRGNDGRAQGLCNGKTLGSDCARFSIFIFSWIEGHLGEVFQQHPVDEDVAAAHLLEENQLSAVIEELDEVEWRITRLATSMASVSQGRPNTSRWLSSTTVTSS